MEKIIPRWEWRTFGKDFGKAENNIKKYEITIKRESSEIYILSNFSNDNTKIRNEKMDIKSPLRTNHNGLEQWTVLMKSAFPIYINDLALVYKAFNLKLPYLEKDEYSYEEYLQTLIKPNKDLKMIDVFKLRNGFMIDDCIVEIAEVKFNEIPLRTIAVEQADPQLVIKTVRKLGLNGFENINYIKVMKRIFGISY